MQRILLNITGFLLRSVMDDLFSANAPWAGTACDEPAQQHQHH
ncbi:hypothetical protein [Parasphingorhabdus sp.]